MARRTGGRAATTGVIPGRYALSVGDPQTETPCGWRWTRLLDVARLETGHTPSRKKPEYWGGDVPWIGIKSARAAHGKDIYETGENTNSLGLENSAARLLPAGTVCLSRTASIGYVTRLGRPMATSQDFVNWVCGEGLDSRYLMYVLLAETESLFRFAHGTTHQTIYFPEVKAFHAMLPPIAEQRRIAAVLGALDDKIELNRQMNHTLEEMAQAIFKSWFVDFDGHDDLVDSELGPIPRGWKVDSLGTVIELKRGYDLPKRKRQPGAVKIVSSAGITGVHSEPKLTGPAVITGRYGTIGRVYYLEEPCWPLNTTLYVRDFRGNEPYFAYHLLGMIDFNSFSDKAAVPGVNRNHLHLEPVIVPPVEAQRSFARITRPLVEGSWLAERESLTLSDLRDTLLSKLISGEIRVPEAEEVVEAS